MTSTLKAESGSFRDRNNRVYYAENAVVRGISEAALEHWEKIIQEPVFQQMLNNGKIVPTSILDRKSPPAASVIGDGWAGVLQHDRIPFITYPYEWTFGMLKDAALLHLDILERSIEAGWTLKDATSYNVQWRGTTPTFIDTTSFEPYVEGEPWKGYRQFCMMFIIPLLLKAHRDIDYIPLLRSNLEGIDPAEAAKIFGWTDILKTGVFSHVWLHAKMQKTFSDEFSEKKTDRKQPSIRHSKAMVLGTIQSLQRAIKKLSLKNAPTTWGDYDETHSYDDQSYTQKQDFVKKHIAKKHWPLVWDIGCNTGTFSKICSPHAGSVVAIDGDALAIEKLYQRQKKNDPKGNVLPLVMSLGNVSPAQGWRGQERKALEARGTPDFLLCLALIHHMVISANIPLKEYITWLRGLNSHIILEFVGPEDEMTKHLLKNKVNQYSDYTEENFEKIVQEMFIIADSMPLKNGVRKIYYLQPKN